MNSIVNRSTEFTLPDELQYILNATVSRTAATVAIVSMLLVFTALVVFIVLIRKKQKGPMFGIFGGAATYLIFYYFASNTIVNLLFMIPVLKANVEVKALVIPISAVINALIPVLGRILTMKVFAFRCTKVGDQLSFGIGIMATEAVVVIANLFLNIIVYTSLAKTGIAEMLSGAETQEAYLEMAKEVDDMLSYDPMLFFLQAIRTISYMIFHVALTIPLFAAFQNKVSKAWYAGSFGAYLVLNVLRFLRSYGILPETVEAVITMLFTAAFSYVVYVMYKKLYKDEERAGRKEEPVKNGSISGAAKKRMPKYINPENGDK